MVLIMEAIYYCQFPYSSQKYESLVRIVYNVIWQIIWIDLKMFKCNWYDNDAEE